MLGNKLDMLMGKTKSFLKTLNTPISIEILIGDGYRCEVFYSKILSYVYLIDSKGVCKRRVIKDGKEMESRKTSAKNLKELCEVLNEFNVVKYSFLTVFNDYSIDFVNGRCENGFYDFKEFNNAREAYNGLYNAIKSISKSQSDGKISLKSDSNCLGVFARSCRNTGKTDRYYIYDNYTVYANIKTNVHMKYHTMFIRMLHNVCSYFQDIESIEIDLDGGTMTVEKSNDKVMEAILENGRVVSVRELSKGESSR